MASLLKVQFHFHLSSAFEQIEPLALQTSPAPSPRFRPPPFCNFWLLLCVQICFFKVICPADWASPTRRTGAWVDSGSWWWTRRPGVLWFMGLQRVGHYWATELNWTDWQSGKWKCWSLSHVLLFLSPWTVAYQAPLSMEFSRQEYWIG